MRKILKYLVTCLVLISIVLPLTSASVYYYPPWIKSSYQFEKGYNVTWGYNTTTISNSSLKLESSGGYLYVVTNTTLDLRNISFIEIDWAYSASSGTTPTPIFGVAWNKSSMSFNKSLNKSTSTFTRRHDNLSLNGSGDDYYIKVGFWSSAVAGGIATLYIYGIYGHNYSYSHPVNATSVTSSSAILVGKLVNDSDTTCTVGFWYGNESTSQALVTAGFATNVSVGSGYDAGDGFSSAISGLTPGDYYYFRTWSKDSQTGCFNISDNESYFIALPDVSTNFVAIRESATSLYLSWTNASVPTGTNHSVYIRYSTSSYPTSLTSGTFGANESKFANVSIGGLLEDTTYYFSAWTYVNNSGSPECEAFSSSYATTYNTTAGGRYYFNVRFENETDGANNLINLSQYGPHKLIIYYEDSLDEVIFYGNTYTSTVASGMYSLNTSGNFSLNLTEQPIFFEFRWNESIGATPRCYRMIVPESSQRLTTFYVRTDLLVYGEPFVYFNGSIVKYTVGFLDYTSLFIYPNEPMATFFKYNTSGVKMIIDSQYFDTARLVHPWLAYDEKYFIGVSCTLLTYERIGHIIASSTVEQTEFAIPLQNNIVYNIYDLINVNYGWSASGLYLNYTDTTHSTAWVEFTVRYFYNDTFIVLPAVPIPNNQTGANSYNFTWLVAGGCKLYENYTIQINCSLNDDVSTYYEGLYTTGKLPVISGMGPITDNETLDYIFIIIFGESPLYNSDDSSIFVSWTYILIFVVCFILLTTFGKLNAFLGGFAVGLFLIFAGSVITGVQTLFSNYSFWQGASTVVVGVFITALSVLGLMGGVENR